MSKPQADRIDAHDRQRSLGVGRLDDRPHVFELSEEVGVLDHDRRGLVGHDLRDRLGGDPSVGRGDRDQLGLEVVEKRRQNLAVFGMDRSGDHNLSVSAA